jgi:uncharacterized protein (DUF2235 family)
MALYAFNGTWNSEKTDDVATEAVEYDLNTNVVKFRDAYEGPHFYVNGVGTRLGRFGGIFGGAFGVGGYTRLDEAKQALQQNLARGDRVIDIVGFSRGAALAATFAHRTCKDNPGLPIRFVGVWDLVGSFGIPFSLGPLRFQEYNIGYKFDVPPSVQHYYHALALDERRQTFRPTRIVGAHEVWFRGAHSDVGGGNGNLGLNCIALCWMLRKAAASGLPIKPAVLEKAAGGCMPECAVKWPKDYIKNDKREIKGTDRVHYSVARRDDAELNDPPPSAARESADDERRAVQSDLFRP